MRKNKPITGKILVFAAAIIFSAILAGAHSLYLFDINLDFDKELESGVIKAAQEFFKTDEKPSSFDLDKGLIMVHFGENSGKYTEINPIGYSVFGMRDESLKHKEGG